MKIHILTDNRVKKRGLVAEHGLSIYIEHENTYILFDTGQSDVYCRNADKMGVDLKQADCIVLSHGHYDHGGGLIHFPVTEGYPPIYVHPDAFSKRYTYEMVYDRYREIGIPWSPDDLLPIKDSLRYCCKKTEIIEGIHLISEIPSMKDFEGVPQGFFIGDGESRGMDMFADEQMLVWETEKGLSVFLGCGHPGAINCLAYLRQVFPDSKIYSLVAGMHMENVSRLRLESTIRHILDYDIQVVVPLHCTGAESIYEMKRFMGDRCHTLCTGDILTL